MSTTRPSSWTQSLGLVLAGFLVGIIVENINRSTSSPDRPAVAGVDQDVYSEAAGSYRKIAQTGVWDVLIDSSAQGRGVALGQGGEIRVIVIDDKSALYVMTY